MKKPLEENGIHRAKLWEIGFYALNNTSTNIYMMLMSYISYYLIGIVGVGAVLAGSFVTIMRIWDGVTDPFVGYFVDKTNSKFGKNRPFIVIGQIILFASSFVLFNVTPSIPKAGRFPFFIAIYMIYIIGYTCQCVVTKSAQSCLTNDPKQRPIFAMFDSVYNILAMSMIIPVYISGTLIPKFNVTDKAGNVTLSAFYNPEMFHHLQLVFGGIAAVFAVLAIIGLWRKDRQEYFGTGETVKVGFKDYIDVLAHNRAIQMLVASASSDKLSNSMATNATIMITLFGVICGNYALYGSVSAITSIPICILSILGMGVIARNLGQKKALVIGTAGSIIFALGLFLLMYLGDPTSMKLPVVSGIMGVFKGSTWSLENWSLYGIIFMLLYILMRGFMNVAGSIVIPMTADCADYEVYRSGKYVPGLMGTLFSCVDKIISSLAATFVAVMFTAIGFKKELPVESTPYSDGIFWVTMACFIGAPLIGWIINLIAMKFYPLTKEKMEEIQEEIAAIKAKAMAQK